MAKLFGGSLLLLPPQILHVAQTNMKSFWCKGIQHLSHGIKLSSNSITETSYLKPLLSMVSLNEPE